MARFMLYMVAALLVSVTNGLRMNSVGGVGNGEAQPVAADVAASVAAQPQLTAADQQLAASLAAQPQLTAADQQQLLQIITPLVQQFTPHEIQMLMPANALIAPAA